MFRKVLIALLALAFVGSAEAHHGRGGPNSTPTISAGVIAGAGGHLVSSTDGVTPVYLTGMGVQGMEFGQWSGGLNQIWTGISNVLTSQWSSGMGTIWYNSLQASQGTAIANAYGKFNTIRLYLNSSNYMGYAGLDPGNAGHDPGAATNYSTVGTNANGHVIYCAGAVGTCGLGTTDGTETSGDPTAYRNAVRAVVNNVEGTSPAIGYTTYVILNLDYTTPELGTNSSAGVVGQKLLPTSQPAYLSPADLAFWQQIALDYKGDQRVIFELMNEAYGSGNAGSNPGGAKPSEARLLGDGNNGGTANWVWPNSTTIAAGGATACQVDFGTHTINQNTTCLNSSFQQAVNTIRSQGATNFILVGSMVATSALEQWAENGGPQTVTDPFTINGHQQIGASLHAYTYNGSIFGNAANITRLIAAGKPFVVTEYGTMTAIGSTGSNGYSWCKANGCSGQMPTAWANFQNQSNIYNQGSQQISTFNPYSNTNVPNPAGGPSQLPNNINLRPTHDDVHWHRFERKWIRPLLRERAVEEAT